MSKLKIFYDLLKQTFTEWNEDRAPRLAAALAYYTAFSIAPLLIVVIAIVGFVVSQDVVQNQILLEVRKSVGSEAAKMVGELIANASKPAEGLISAVLGIATLLLGAAGAFGQLQDSLNTIWDVDQEATGKRNVGVIYEIRSKFLSFGMVLVVGFLLLVSLVMTTALSAINGYLVGMLPGVELLLGLANTILTFVIITVLFALIFKFLPKIHLKWQDVIIGAAMTSLLFSIGRLLLGWYLARSSTASAYGAAGSFVLILLWIYYSAQIMLFGAEFTQVFARRYGSLQKSRTVPAPREASVTTAPAPGSTGKPHTSSPQIGTSLEETSLPSPGLQNSGGALSGLIFIVGIFVVTMIASRFDSRRTNQRS